MNPNVRIVAAPDDIDRLRILQVDAKPLAVNKIFRAPWSHTGYLREPIHLEGRLVDVDVERDKAEDESSARPEAEGRAETGEYAH